MKRFLVLGGVAVFAFLFAGCGTTSAVCPEGTEIRGGSCVAVGIDAGDVDAGLVDGLSDQDGPIVVSTSPDSDALGVEMGAEITVVFDESLDAVTVKDVSFSVTDALGPVGSVRFFVYGVPLLFRLGFFLRNRLQTD